MKVIWLREEHHHLHMFSLPALKRFLLEDFSHCSLTILSWVLKGTSSPKVNSTFPFFSAFFSWVITCHNDTHIHNWCTPIVTSRCAHWCLHWPWGDKEYQERNAIDVFFGGSATASKICPLRILTESFKTGFLKVTIDGRYILDNQWFVVKGDPRKTSGIK